MTHAVRWVCFDVGEVLVDETRVWSVWAGLAGVSPLTFHAVLGATLASGGSHVNVLERLVGDWRSRLDEHERAYGGFAEEDLYADVRPTLAGLRRLGLRVAVAGNQPARRTRQLEALDLPADVVATSAQLGARKPAADFFAAVLDACGEPRPGHLLYVGDRLDNDIAPAAAYGMRTVWLRRGPWALLQPAPAGGSQADLVVDRLDDVLDALKRKNGGDG